MIYVDDIIITINNNKEAKKLVDHSIERFEVKNLGSLKYFVGIEIAHSSKELSVT